MWYNVTKYTKPRSIIIFRTPLYSVLLCQTSKISHDRAGIPPNIYIIINIPSRNASTIWPYYRTTVIRYRIILLPLLKIYSIYLTSVPKICFKTHLLPSAIHAFLSSCKNEYLTRSSLWSSLIFSYGTCGTTVKLSLLTINNWPINTCIFSNDPYNISNNSLIVNRIR